MRHSGPPPSRPDEEPEVSNLARAKGVLGIELFALAVALVTPILPSKTGSTWSFAELFWADPTYLQEVVVGFAVVNALLVVIALCAWIALKVWPPSEA